MREHQDEAAVALEGDGELAVGGQRHGFFSERAAFAIGDEAAAGGGGQFAQIDREGLLGGFAVDAGDIPAAVTAAGQHGEFARITFDEARVLQTEGTCFMKSRTYSGTLAIPEGISA